MSRPTPGPDLLTLIAQAREATSELRAAIKDMKTAKRDAEEGIAKLMQDAVVDHLDAIVKRETAEMGAQFKAATDAATAKVAAVCHELFENYMRGESRNNVRLDEAMAARQLLRRWDAEHERDHKQGNGR
jgi:hypothetical protein